ncbi:MAG: hypothetical protein HOM52_17065 [Rhodospirillaceae bacterium]|jgi:hypothetical protein|nr:hypothetical protein [Rhodospirillaceae bacterium]MBT5040216.1 hypothetical protein [Rhodospirillaceae bacterium]MBT5674374.1 hypothetical protein [Rhodospirillaceae bacterium]MBT5777937.1 hypothetical protein [Rhodospirillaceae bacterium]MBT7293007.1 hypothetical protein [Rhodospirillaceae bacterium]
MRLFGALIIAALLSASPAQAGFSEGYKAYIDGDFETALEELRPLAEKGRPMSQGILGFMYA